jgi:hypothetical protein
MHKKMPQTHDIIHIAVPKRSGLYIELLLPYNEENIILPTTVPMRPIEQFKLNANAISLPKNH